MVINRDFARTVHDDFILNVECLLDKTNEAIPIYGPGPDDDDDANVLIGWKIQPRYE